MVPSEVREYAREMYMCIDVNGGHAYTETEISDALLEKFNYKVHRGTISRWSLRVDHLGNTWKRIREASIREGVRQNTPKEPEIDEQTYNESKTEVVDKPTVNVVGDRYANAVSRHKLCNELVVGMLTSNLGTLHKLAKEWTKIENGTTVSAFHIPADVLHRSIPCGLKYIIELDRDALNTIDAYDAIAASGIPDSKPITGNSDEIDKVLFDRSIISRPTG